MSDHGNGMPEIYDILEVMIKGLKFYLDFFLNFTKEF